MTEFKYPKHMPQEGEVVACLASSGITYYQKFIRYDDRNETFICRNPQLHTNSLWLRARALSDKEIGMPAGKD